MKKEKFAITVRVGDTHAKIYKIPYRDSIGFTVVWYEGEKRQRHR